MGIVLSLFHFLSSTHPSSLDEKVHLLCDSVDSNAALASELRGKKIHVDMTQSFRHWPNRARHCALERLRHETDRVLEKVLPDPVRCKKFKKCDFGLFACLWWPDAEWEDLYTVMLFTVCLFVWDDTIDTNEDALASDFRKASVWRQQTLAYFKYHLKLSPAESNEPKCPDNVCLLFKEFAERFCANSGKVQRRRLYSKIENFVHHNELEQAERLADRIPTYEEYMSIRYGVTGVRMFSLLLEITNRSALPSWVMDSPEMEQIIKECNLIIIIINDILSLKKELATDCVINVVPVLYKMGVSLNQVIALLIEHMHQSRDRLDNMAAELDRMTKTDPQLNVDILKFIDGIRTMDTGTLVYSMESPRYGVRKYLQPDGSLDIIL